MIQYMAVSNEIAPLRTDDAVRFVTRFAPSPNGYLHIGHAFAAIVAHDLARQNDGQFLLRIEDIDGARSRDAHINGIIDDLHWLGLSWDGDVLLQSTRDAAYQTALDSLDATGLVYRCFCSRQDIAATLQDKAVLHGPDGPHYPGTCRDIAPQDSDRRALAEPFAWRLDMAKAIDQMAPLTWCDQIAGTVHADPAIFGDIILWRKDALAGYHLAATIDDAYQAITHVVRGLDLFPYTHIHRLLQELLGLPQPEYLHHALLLDPDGKKLAKSLNSPTLRARRLAGEDGMALAQSLRSGELPLGISVSST